MKNKLPHIAIIFTFNDIQHSPGSTKTGMKSYIDFFSQFMIAYESIRENWNQKYFTYEFFIIHTDDFNEDRKKILNSIDVTLIRTKCIFGYGAMRHLSFLEKIDCDFKLVLDNDVVGLSTPNFNFDKDALITYESSKYNYQQWISICEDLNLKVPIQKPIAIENGYYHSWNDNEYLYYYKNRPLYNLFPSLNAGAFLIKNDLSYLFGCLLGMCSAKYNNLVLSRDNVNIEYVSQDIYGVCLDNITKNWEPFEFGFNFIFSNLPNLKNYSLNEYDGNITLFHYISLNDDNKFSEIVKSYHNRIKEKYNV